MTSADHPRVQPRTIAGWARWLGTHHAKERGAWLVAYRGTPGKRGLPYDQAVEEALCHGWIDSVVKPLDDERTMTLYTPRKAGSGWSRSNKDRVARLMKAGRMRPAGLAKIAAAKKDGSWTLLDPVEALVVPPDLRSSLGASGMKRFEALTPGKKKEHLYALTSAKRPETRAKRIDAIVASLR